MDNDSISNLLEKKYGDIRKRVSDCSNKINSILNNHETDLNSKREQLREMHEMAKLRYDEAVFVEALLTVVIVTNYELKNFKEVQR